MPPVSKRHRSWAKILLEGDTIPLSLINIDTDKDWNAKAIVNLAKAGFPTTILKEIASGILGVRNPADDDDRDFHVRTIYPAFIWFRYGVDGEIATVEASATREIRFYSFDTDWRIAAKLLNGSFEIARGILTGNLNAANHTVKNLWPPADVGDALRKGSRLTATEMLDGAAGLFLKGQGVGVDPIYASIALPNLAKGITPTASNWNVTPTNLENITDEDEGTVTGWGRITNTHNSEANAAIITIDLGTPITYFPMMICAKIGYYTGIATKTMKFTVRCGDLGTTTDPLVVVENTTTNTTEKIVYIWASLPQSPANTADKPRYLKIRCYHSGLGLGEYGYFRFYEAYVKGT